LGGPPHFQSSVQDFEGNAAFDAEGLSYPLYGPEGRAPLVADQDAGLLGSGAEGLAS
jgi:hypothetical protein